MLDIALKFLTNYGFPIGFVAFFIYRDYLREKDMTAKIRALEVEIQGILKETLVKTTQVIERNNSFMIQLIKAWAKRRCIADIAEDQRNENQNVAV